MVRILAPSVNKYTLDSITTPTSTCRARTLWVDLMKVQAVNRMTLRLA